jgi:hypothetical protein
MRNLWVLLLLLILAGCSGPGPDSRPQPAPAATSLAGEKPPGPQAAINPVRKLILNVALTLRVAEINATSQKVRATAAELGGFVSNSRFDVNSDQNETASIEVKVPSDKLILFLTQVEPLGKVLSKSETGEDVTEQFVDLDARRNTLKREEERLLEILKSAGGLKDLLAVEQELARVRGELEQTEGKLKHLNYQVDYSTVTITLTANGQGQSVSFWDLSGTVANSWLMLKVCLRFLLQSAIYFAFLVPLIVPGWFIYRKLK